MMMTVAFYMFSVLLLCAGVGAVRSPHAVHGVLWLIFAFFNAAGLFLLLGAEFLAMILLIVYVGAVAVLFLFVVMMRDSPEPGAPESQGGKSQTPLSHKKKTLRALGKDLGFLIILGFLGKIIFMGFLGVLALWSLDLREAFQINFLFLRHGPESLVSLPFWDIFLPFGDSDGLRQESFWVWGALVMAVFLALKGTQKIMKRSCTEVARSLKHHVPWPWVLAFVFATEMAFMIFLWGDSSVTRSLIGTLHFSIDTTLSNTEALGQILYTDYLYVFYLSGMVLLLAMMGAIVLTLRKGSSRQRQNIHTQVSRRKQDTLQLKDVAVGKGLGHHD